MLAAAAALLVANSVLSGAYDYRIRGKRGTIQAVSFLTQGSNFGQGGTMLPTGFLDTDSLQVEPDGSFEIRVSAKPQPGNWLPQRTIDLPPSCSRCPSSLRR